MTSERVEQVLPPHRSPGATYRIALVCLGNICRSPMAEVVLADKLDAAGLSEHVEVVSAGTGGWHVGNPMDRRAAAVLTARGYDASQHRAQQLDPRWLPELDLVLAMDESNHGELAAYLDDLEEDASRLRLFRDFDPHAREGDREVPDPYYGGDDGFDHVMTMVERTAASLVDALAVEVGRR